MFSLKMSCPVPGSYPAFSWFKSCSFFYLCFLVFFFFLINFFLFCFPVWESQNDDQKIWLFLWYQNYKNCNNFEKSKSTRLFMNFSREFQKCCSWHPWLNFSSSHSNLLIIKSSVAPSKPRFIFSFHILLICQHIGIFLDHTQLFLRDHLSSNIVNILTWCELYILFLVSLPLCHLSCGSLLLVYYQNKKKQFIIITTFTNLCL